MAENPLLKKLPFNPAGGNLSIEVFFGQAQLGEYTVKLYDQNGKNPQFTRVGNNIDDVPDKFSIPDDPETLTNKVLSWVLTITTPLEEEGQLYFARITIRQDGQMLKDGEFKYEGQFQDFKIILEAVRLLA